MTEPVSLILHDGAGYPIRPPHFYGYVSGDYSSCIGDRVIVSPFNSRAADQSTRNEALRLLANLQHDITTYVETIETHFKDNGGVLRDLITPLVGIELQTLYGPCHCVSVAINQEQAADFRAYTGQILFVEVVGDYYITTRNNCYLSIRIDARSIARKVVI